MGGSTNFPTSLDDNTSLYDVTDGVDYPIAAHHNNLKEAVKALESKLGIDSSAVTTSLDYLLSHVGKGAVKYVAASDSLAANRGYADYLCDGAGDQVEIAAAIAALPASGGVIVLSEGNFSLSASISPVSNLTIIGAGIGKTTITVSGVGYAAIYNVAGMNNLTIRDITFDGNSKTGGISPGGLIQLAGANDLLIETVEIKQAKDSGIFIGVGADRLRILNGKFHDNGNTGGNGITIWSQVYRSQIRGNVCYNNTTHGIWSACDAANVGTKHNDYNIITENICYSNSWAGIYADTGSYHTTIQNNICYSNTHAQIYVYGSDDEVAPTDSLQNDVDVSNNFCYGAADQAMIFFFKVGSRMKCNNNTIIGVGDTSIIGIRSSCGTEGTDYGMQIIGNFVYNCQTGITPVFWKHVNVSANYVSNCTQRGIRIYNCLGFTVSGNSVFNCSIGNSNLYGGIVVYDIAGSSNGVISGNVSEDTQGAPTMKYCIDTENAGADILIIGNKVSGGVTANIKHRATDLVRNNQGYLTENKGTGSIANATTSAVINHGLAVTPTAGDIIITLTENPTNTPGAVWVDNISSTQFTVNVENDPGASNLDFSWKAIMT